MLSRTSRIILGAIAATAVAWSASGPARAQSVMAVCGQEWKDAKAKGSVEAGTTWPKYLSECRARHKDDAAAATPAAPAAPAATEAAAPPPAPAPATTTAAAPAPAAPTSPAATTTAAGKAPAKGGGREAMLARERQCGARWKEVKGTSSLPAGITKWPKYWSWCNTQLKNGQSI